MTKKKAKKIIEKTREQKQWRLRPDDIQYIIELAGEHPRWSAERIFEEARKPKIRSCLMVSLTPKIKNALTKAAKRYQISITDVCYHILDEWFKAHKLYEE